MNSRRLILISRRYWPLVGGAERAMAGLANQFHSMGHGVRVLTARWETQWPAELVHRDVPVTRLPNPKTRAWGTYRYMAHLGSWLKAHQDQFDAVLVSMLKHDAHVAVRVLKKINKPTIIRAEGGGATGDCAFHRTARFGSRIRKTCMKADAVIAPSETVESELIASGFDSNRVHHVSNGVEIRKSPQIRNPECRRALGETHPILAVPPGEPLVVYTGRLDIAKGLLDLVEAWQTVARTYPNGRLWLVGEGADARKIWDRIRETRQGHQIIMPGSFDDVGEILAAADAFVLPSYQEGMSLSLLEAMAAGLPAVVSDIPGNRDLVSGNRGFLFPPGEPDKLSESLLAAIGRQAKATEFADTARSFVEANYSLNRMAEDHLRIIDKAIQAAGQLQTG